MLDAEGRARVEEVADDEDAVEDAESDEQLVEGVPQLGLQHDQDGHEIPGEAEYGDDDGDHAVQPPSPILQNLEVEDQLHLKLPTSKWGSEDLQILQGSKALTISSYAVMCLVDHLVDHLKRSAVPRRLCMVTLLAKQTRLNDYRCTCLACH